jgi:exosortase E/protease (VPEID-CTERM system)
MPFFTIPRHLLGRLYLLAAIGAAEGVLVVGVLRVGPALHSHLILIVAVGLGVFLTIGHRWLKAQSEDIPLGFGLFGAYILLLAIGILCRLLSERGGSGSLSSLAASIAASPLLLVRIPLIILACIPLRSWSRMLRETNPLWLIASVAGVATWALNFPIRAMYAESSAVSSHFLQVLTFRSLEPILRVFLPGFAPDPVTYTIGTARFSVVVFPSCAGIEGLGLVLVFTTVWLWYFRKECRFPQALLLVPIALVSIWVLNIVRLCVLTLIGSTISPEIALVGIHSHVGWITFIVVALGFFMATQRLSWVRKEPIPVSCAEGHPGMDGLTTVAREPEHPIEHRGESPAIRAYLVPFLAILATSFVTKAASGYFEWLYPLRFVVAAIVLWHFRPELKKLNWRFGWMAPLAGIAIFMV